MSDVVLAALIGAGGGIIVSLLGLWATAHTNKKSNRELVQKIDQKMEVYRAVTDEKISELTREVRKHNNFAERMPVVENEIVHMHEDVNRLKKFHERG